MRRQPKRRKVNDKPERKVNQDDENEGDSLDKDSPGKESSGKEEVQVIEPVAQIVHAKSIRNPVRQIIADSWSRHRTIES
jgi:hypothetical protein